MRVPGFGQNSLHSIFGISRQVFRDWLSSLATTLQPDPDRMASRVLRVEDAKIHSESFSPSFNRIEPNVSVGAGFYFVATLDAETWRKRTWGGEKAPAYVVTATFANNIQAGYQPRSTILAI